MAKQQKMDDEDSLRRRARRRLIGAVALITVVVVVLPMVLDKEPKPADQNIELRIPDKNSVGEFNPKMEPVPASAPSAASSVSEATVKPAAEPKTVAMPQAEAKARPANNKVHVEAAQQKLAKPAESSATGKSSAKPHATAGAAGKPVGEVAHAAETSGFVVQVGAYANAQTAHDLQKKLNQKGIKAYAEKVGNITRVRVGPFKTRDEANKAQTKLEAQGLKPIVAPVM